MKRGERMGVPIVAATAMNAHLAMKTSACFAGCCQAELFSILAQKYYKKPVL
ncbi:hypothetical protein [Geobacillus jurassicus]|uniref:Uncharacterized protein n=1 Tax=Geobacillus jurassicus TaxID=235932 RepID=A0ABV6GNW7_9BACL|nr:hypothetical protein [Geobacillus jurassicus]